MRWTKSAFIHIVLFLAVVIFGEAPGYFLLLTVAQVVYVPLTLQMIAQKGEWFAAYYPYFSFPAYFSVVLLQITNQTEWDIWLAAVYLLFTLIVALYGISRFFQRGFVHFEEFSIDMGLIYLSIGGMWFFAHIANIDTGFSPMITWLTAIHFHYTAFLLPVFVGFLGRIYKLPLYNLAASIILLSPIILAIGITFSTWIELLSVMIYIAGIYSFIFLSVKAPFSHLLQKWLIILSFGSLGVTILFSLLYALGNVAGEYSVSIDFMLRFHGFLNCVLFALLGVIGWSMFVPPAKTKKWTFPVSKVMGKSVIGEKILSDIVDNRAEFSYKGLVDQMLIYESDIDRRTLSPAILDFYENTTHYRLYAEVNWHFWFKPFAAVYRLISRYVQQINLPLSRRRIEMTGDLFAIKEELDGRSGTRAWVRKVDKEVTFVALYSSHQTKNRTYMNIALPLPWSAMIGVLELKQIGHELQLSSKKRQANSDSGIYLAVHKHLITLPIEETFHVKEGKDGTLRAQHNMWIFSVPFLKIDYWIDPKTLGNRV